MLETLRIVFPIFAVIGIGWWMGRKKLIGEGGVTGIVNFVFLLAIPCLLFRTLSQGHIRETFDLELVLTYYGAATVQFGLVWLVSRKVFGNPGDTSAIAALGGTFSNLALLGIPLVQRAYGDAGLVPLMLLIMLHSGTLFTLTILALGFGRSGRSESLGKTLKGVLSSVLLNPIVLACMAGMAWSATGLDLPGVIDDTLAFVGRSASPVALLAVGVTLSSEKLAGDLREILTITTLKLVLFPLLVWGLASLVFEHGPGWLTIAILAAASPAGANVHVFANRYQLYVKRATGVVLLTTALSVISMIVLIGALPKPGG
jgi:predicted permease